MLDELRALRKRTDGASVAGLASSPTITQLVGNGDPLVAWSRLQHLALDAEWSREIEAACYSLGFASTSDTHLGRLEDFAAEFYMDERQARRYSDRGLIELSRLITSNWILDAVPTCDVVLNANGPTCCELYARCGHPESVRMDPPRFEVLSDAPAEELHPQWVTEQHDGRCTTRFARPAAVLLSGETSLVVRWSGEVWPKFSAQLSGSWVESTPVVECLGNKMMIRWFPSGSSSETEGVSDKSRNRGVAGGDDDQN
ncbi:hypothetical protein [Gordonia rhizosphera]|uniref:hypothetical protein n=1 Tax=Gordonia rhizosphera TaxID=83341 RepID=UPI0012F64E01|nr:hypothetical protein [Gordonia rhizosphera]